MVRKRSEQDVIDQLKTYITDQTRKPDLDVSPGALASDLLESTAQELAETYNTLQTVEESISLQNAATIGTDGMSRLALNFGTVRTEAVKATGTVTFRRTSPPGSAVVIPRGTTISTAPDEETKEFVRFITTEEKSMSVNTFLNPLTGFYEVDVPVIATEAGASGNVGRNTVTVLESNLPNIISITNKFAFTGGEDAETDEDLAIRIRSAISTGKLIGTRSGYKSVLISQFPGLTNVEVVGPSDEAMTRNQFGGAVDIYMGEQNPQAFTESHTFKFGETETRLSARPTLSVSSIVGITTGVIFVHGTDWTFTQDTSTVFGGSVRSNDLITWLPSGSKPGGTQTIRVVGTYDQLVSDAQDFLTDPVRRIPGTDLLVKRAERVYIDATVSVLAFSGYDRTDVATRVRTALIDGLSAYALGDDVEQADLVDLVADVEGVDDVTIPFAVLKRSTDSSGSADISITRRQLARANTPNIIITAT